MASLHSDLPPHPVIGVGERLLVRHHLLDAMLLQLALDPRHEFVAGEGVEFDAAREQEFDFGGVGAVLFEVVTNGLLVPAVGNVLVGKPPTSEPRRPMSITFAAPEKA